jgi:hypothetical protein
MLRAGFGRSPHRPPASVDGELCVTLFIELPAENAAAARRNPNQWRSSVSWSDFGKS